MSLVFNAEEAELVVRRASARSGQVLGGDVVDAVGAFMSEHPDWPAYVVLDHVVNSAMAATRNPTAYVVHALGRDLSAMRLPSWYGPAIAFQRLQQVESGPEFTDGWRDVVGSGNIRKWAAREGDETNDDDYDWPDVDPLDDEAFEKFLRQASADTLRDYADRIEGVTDQASDYLRHHRSRAASAPAAPTSSSCPTDEELA